MNLNSNPLETYTLKSVYIIQVCFSPLITFNFNDHKKNCHYNMFYIFFKVTAATVIGESPPSNITDVTYHSDRIKKHVTNFAVKYNNISCVSLSWSLLPKENKVKNYIVTFKDSWGQDQIITKKDKDQSCQSRCIHSRLDKSCYEKYLHKFT